LSPGAQRICETPKIAAPESETPELYYKQSMFIALQDSCQKYFAMSRKRYGNVQHRSIEQLMASYYRKKGQEDD